MKRTLIPPVYTVQSFWIMVVLVVLLVAYGHPWIAAISFIAFEWLTWKELP